MTYPYFCGIGSRCVSGEFRLLSTETGCHTPTSVGTGHDVLLVN